MHVQTVEGLFEIGDRFVADLVAFDVERLELAQALQMREPCVRDLGVLQDQVPEIGQPGEVGQALRGDLAAPQTQRLELRQPGQVLEPFVGDGRLAEI